MEISLQNAQLFPQLKITHKNKKLEINSTTRFIYKSGDTIDGGSFGYVGSHEDPLDKKVFRDNKSINILKWLNANAMVNIKNDDITDVQKKLMSKFGNNSPFLMHLNYLKNKDTHDF